MTKEAVIALIEELEKRAEFHRTNQNDPYGIGNAVATALREVADALRAANE